MWREPGGFIYSNHHSYGGKEANILCRFPGGPHAISLLVFTAGLVYACMCWLLVFPTTCLQSGFCSQLATEAGFATVTNNVLVSTLREHIFTPWPLPLSILGFPVTTTLFPYRDFTCYLSSCCSFSSLFSFSLLFLFVPSFRFCPKNSCLLALWLTQEDSSISMGQTRDKQRQTSSLA